LICDLFVYALKRIVLRFLWSTAALSRIYQFNRKGELVDLTFLITNLSTVFLSPWSWFWPWQSSPC